MGKECQSDAAGKDWSSLLTLKMAEGDMSQGIALETRKASKKILA